MYPAALEEKLNYKFKNKNLLTTALCHKSYINEAGGKNVSSYERLEFLGDSVLGVIVSRYIYDNFTSFPEGKLSRLRASVVCEENLALVARRLGIGNYIILGKGEAAGGGADKDTILCDVFEAVIAAMYLDSDMTVAENFVMDMLKDIIDEHALVHKDNIDYKTLLQEWVQRDGGTVVYEILSQSGPDHDKRYVAGVYVCGDLVAQGEGSSKKKAHQSAAGNALKILQN